MSESKKQQVHTMESDLAIWCRNQGKSLRWLRQRVHLIKRAWEGLDYPSPYTPLGRALRRQLKDDPGFRTGLRALRLDWFQGVHHRPGDPMPIKGGKRFPHLELSRVIHLFLHSDIDTLLEVFSEENDHSRDQK